MQMAAALSKSPNRSFPSRSISENVVLCPQNMEASTGYKDELSRGSKVTSLDDISVSGMTAQTQCPSNSFSSYTSTR